jgi:hypothetical protein
MSEVFYCDCACVGCVNEPGTVIECAGVEFAIDSLAEVWNVKHVNPVR